MFARTSTLALGSALLARHDYEAAVERFAQAVQQNDRDVQAYHGLGWSLCRAAGGKLPNLRAAEMDLATEALARAVSLDPNNSTSAALLALCFMNAGAPERAAQVVQNFIQRHPLDVELVGLMSDLATQPDLAAVRLGLITDEALVAPAQATTNEASRVYAGPRLTMPTQPQRTAALPEFMNLSYSQEGEDLVLARIFGAHTVGVYVDVGAHHPLRFSNTHRFYLQGWRGVNIEPNPDLYQAFQNARPGDINLTCGVSDSYGSLTYYMFDEPALNSFDADLSASRQGGAYKIVETRVLDVVPLSAILDQCLQPGMPIHFLSVDVEGLDLQVLQSNDWERHRPFCVVAECLRSDVQTVLASQVHGFMRAQGYRLFAKTFNSVFYLETDFEV